MDHHHAVTSNLLREARRGFAFATKKWVVLALTVLIVPGGVFVGLAYLAQAWNRRRAAARIAAIPRAIAGA